MNLILIVDDMALVREPIAASLRGHGFETMCASDGREAIGCVKTRTPDVILLDIALPVMDGLEFLQTMNSDPSMPKPPVILLTATADKNSIMKAARLGVHGCILKTQFSLDELLARIEFCLKKDDSRESVDSRRALEKSAGTPLVEKPQLVAPTESAVPSSEHPVTALSSVTSTLVPSDPHAALKALKPLMTKSKALERIEECDELKAFSPVLTEVLKLTGRDNGTIGAIARAIKKDHAIAVKILRLANSAVYTRGDPVESVEKAIMRIGMAQIRQVLLNIGVIDQFSSISIGNQIDGGQFWEHAIGCGIIATEVAHSINEDAADLAFTMGLVHDIGRIIFARQFGEDYIRVLEVAQELQLPLEQVEGRLLQLSHADGMDRLLHAWKFPKDLIDPVVFHHLSIGNIRRMSPRRVEEVATLALANRLCHALAIGSSGNDIIYPTEEFCKALKLNAKTIQRIEESVPAQTESLKLALLARSTAEVWLDRRKSYQEALAGPLRPLFISANPEFDAYRIFCEQLSDRGGEKPNVGIVHLTTPNERSRLTQEFVAAEAEVEAERLPLIVLSPKGTLQLEEGTMAERMNELLPTPVAVHQIIEAVNRLVGSSDVQAAA